MQNNGIYLLLIAIMTMCAGCNMKIHRYYTFNKIEIRTDFEEIHAKLRGTMQNIDKYNSATSSPYELLIWFVVKGNHSVDGCKVTLNSVTLKNTDTDESMLVDGSRIKKFLKKEDRFIASFIFKDLNLKYVDHSLDIRYSIDKEKCLSDVGIKTLNLNFVKDYSERKISFWDALMGI